MARRRLVPDGGPAARGSRSGAAGRPADADPFESRSDASDDAPELAPYERIYEIVRRIPHGRVATYGQIAAIDGRCSARMVGYAMSALDASDVPWQRVINAGGRVSERAGGGGTSRQRRLLAGEGVLFDARGRVDFDVCGWDGPDLEWLEEHGFEPAPRPANPGRRRRG